MTANDYGQRLAAIHARYNQRYGIATTATTSQAPETRPIPHHAIAPKKEETHTTCNRAHEILHKAMHLDGIAQHILLVAKGEIDSAKERGETSGLVQYTNTLKNIQDIIEKERSFNRPGLWAEIYVDRALEIYDLLSEDKQTPILIRAESEVRRHHAHSSY